MWGPPPAVPLSFFAIPLFSFTHSIYFLSVARFSTVRKDALTRSFGLVRYLDLVTEISQFSWKYPNGCLGSFRGFSHLTNLRKLRCWSGGHPLHPKYASLRNDITSSLINTLTFSSLFACRVPFNDLSRLAKLESLEITSDQTLNDSHLAIISFVSSLTSLNLSGSAFGNLSPNALCNMLNALPNLKNLDLNYLNLESMRQQHQSSHESMFPVPPEPERDLISSIKGLKALEMLSLPPRIRQWESLNELPSLRCLCLSEVDFSEPFLSIYGRSDAVAEIESWIFRIEAFKLPVLLQSEGGPKMSILSRVVASGRLDLVNVVLDAPRMNPSLDVNFSAFGADQTALFHATTPEIATALVTKGANINRTSLCPLHGVYSPLRAMIRTRNVSLVDCALLCGADPFLGVAIVDSMTHQSVAVFCLLWERVKGKILEYDDKERSRIVMIAFQAAYKRRNHFYFDAVVSVVGEPYAYACIKAEEATLAQNYPMIWQRATVQQLRSAVAAGIDLRLPDKPGLIELTAAWQLYTKSRDDAVRELIKEEGILTEVEIAAADKKRSKRPAKIR
jgi:hypothetical protein